MLMFLKNFVVRIVRRPSAVVGGAEPAQVRNKSEQHSECLVEYEPVTSYIA